MLSALSSSKFTHDPDDLIRLTSPEDVCPHREAAEIQFDDSDASDPILFLHLLALTALIPPLLGQYHLTHANCYHTSSLIMSAASLLTHQQIHWQEINDPSQPSTSILGSCHDIPICPRPLQEQLERLVSDFRTKRNWLDTLVSFFWP
jgi:hypothetical protein